MIAEYGPTSIPPTNATGRLRKVRVAIQGCSHGELDRIYATLLAREGPPIDLLICCGDFQAIRNVADLETISVPAKYRDIGTFWRYYSGQTRAPIPTIFIGGNHEASAHMQELFYGGWVAPNIYYLGAAGVVRFGGLRIGGISGIYKSNDYRKGHFERPPYDRRSLKSVYHVRSAEVYRMKCLRARAGPKNGSPSVRKPIDIMLSHDWPRGIEQHGNTEALLRKKSFFRQEVEDNNLGSPPNEELMNAIKPTWWFSAHLHVKFEATVNHRRVEAVDAAPSASIGLVPSQVAGEAGSARSSKEMLEKRVARFEERQFTNFVGLESLPCPTSDSLPDLTEQMTRFLSLDKCLPRRQHLHILNVLVEEECDDDRESNESDGKNAVNQLEYDLEWLAIVKKTHKLTQANPSFVDVPNEPVTVSEEEIEDVRSRFHKRHLDTSLENASSNTNFLAIPQNFRVTAPPHNVPGSNIPPLGGRLVGNPQTDELLGVIGLEHVITVPFSGTSDSVPPPQPAPPRQQVSFAARSSNPDENEIDLDEEADETNMDSLEGAREDANEIDLDEDVTNEVHTDGFDQEVKKQRTGSLDEEQSQPEVMAVPCSSSQKKETASTKL